MTLSFKALIAWREEQARAGGGGFMGLPDHWYERAHWFCVNGHVSGNYLKSEERGALCLACREPVVLGPGIGEAAFAPILKALSEGSA